MKKLKLSLGDGGIKGLLLAHVEKIVLGFVALLVIMVIWSGTSLSPIEKNKGADILISNAKSAQDRQREDHWKTIEETRFPVPDAFKEKGDDGNVQVASDDYPNIPLIKPIVLPKTQRSDPRLYEPIELEVEVAFGPVAEGRPAEDGRFGRPKDDGGDEDSRPIPNEILDQLPGFRPSGVGAGAGRRDRAAVVIKPYYIVALKALVPVKRQKLEYERAFKNADGYDESRDVPTYGGKENAYGPNYYTVERAEITPEGEQGDWNVIGESWHSKWYAEKKFTAGTPQEIADPRYVDERFTSTVPPLMLRQLEPLALHSKVGKPSADGEAEEDPDGDSESPDEPGLEPEGPFAPEASELTELGRIPPSRGRDPVIYSGESGFGGSRSVNPEDDVDYKLIRFFDMRVVPGKSYVYRIKLYLVDPNDPPAPGEDGGLAQVGPATKTLRPEVIKRLASKPSADVHWRETKWSEDSGVARIPPTSAILAGAITGGKTTFLRPSMAPVDISEPTAKIMALTWDEKTGMDVAGELELARGSAVNFSKEVEAISPKQWALVKVKADFETGAVLLDMHGATRQMKKDETSSQPAELLLIDQHGRLVIHSELHDKPMYSQFQFPEEKSSTPEEAPELNGEEAGGILIGPERP